MGAFLYGAFLQWKLDIRSKTMLISCYAVPLLFFAIMGGIFTSIMPNSADTLIESMTVFGVTMGALIGLPPSLVEIYGSDIKKVYQANGVLQYWGIILTNLSAYIHLFIMSLIIFATAPLLFGAKLPENVGMYFAGLAVYIAVSLSIASIIGMAVKDQSKTAMFSILLFLPSIMLSGIMFPAELLPKPFEYAGMLFPATWGYRLLIGGFGLENLWPLCILFVIGVIICGILLKKTSKD